MNQPSGLNRRGFLNVGGKVVVGGAIASLLGSCSKAKTDSAVDKDKKPPKATLKPFSLDSETVYIEFGESGAQRSSIRLAYDVTYEYPRKHLVRWIRS